VLGEFEYMLITAAANLGATAYGATIRQDIAEAMKAPCSIGAIYTTIDRLEAKGLLKTRMGEATAQRGGRAKRLVQVTPAGVAAAKEFYSAVTRVSRGASWAPGREGEPA
jgi:PadR family transcriptional regulator, regulatory protein PadR